MELLVWNITKKRISLKGYSEELDTPSPSLSHELNAQQDINEIRSIVGNKSFRDYHHLAKIIIRCMGIKSSTLIEAPYFEYGTAWEVTFPEIGLQLKTQRAVLVLRQKEEGAAWYKNLIKRTMNNAFILLIDIVDVPYSPFQVSPRTIWLSPETLIEMVQTPKDQLPGWLGRYITTRVERNIKQTLLPYATKGPAKMFVGRDYELAGLTRADQYGGIITGAHNSGKSSLLKELGKRLRVEGLNVIGPFELGSIGFQTFFERTLKPFDIAPSEDMTPEGWSYVLRNYCDTGTKPLFLLDEVDDLLNLDAQRGFSLGRQIRSLHNEGYCKFYLAGHAVLRAATGLQYGPFQNFANEVLLRGVTEEASKHLIQVPMKMIGFNVSDEQVQRIYKGTAGVPFLIQDFCIRLLCSLSPSQVSTPDIEASAIEEVEQSHDYLESVYQYYKYAQEWDSLSIMLIIAILGEATRRDIMQELKNRGSSLTRGEIDDILPFLIQFGIIEASKGDLFTIQSRYLYQALMMRDPEPLLDSFLVKGRSG